ncbi:MAG: aminoglycoside phosphotransferase [Alphaproteobacteria bacterium]|nr:aminoglycoside phosphotransferase [Alphaproteobacteria bacterium]
MTAHALPAALEPASLTAILQKAGVLPDGRVTAVRSVHSFPTVLSLFHRLKLDYDGPADGAPRHLYFKTGLPGSPSEAMNSGRREVAFYTTVAPATPPGLLPRCFDAQAGENGPWHVLLEDLTDTHFVATAWPLPPTVAETELIVRCRARFQAVWWDHPRLGDGIGHRPSDGDIDDWLKGLARQYEAFADALGDRLPAGRRLLYEKLFAATPRLVQRTRDWRHMTVTQGDAHVWNCFLPKDGASDTARLFDWDAWQADVGTDDLAYKIAMHWYPERRQRAEPQLLDAFHDELLAGGVTGYDRRALQDDYRLSVLWQTTRPLWMRSVGIPPSIWWSNLERIHLAVEDLDCRALLG